MNIGGWDPTGRDFTRIAPVSAPAAQGDRVLRVGCCLDQIAVGQMVRLLMADPGDGSLMSELHGNRVTVAPEFKGEFPGSCWVLSSMRLAVRYSHSM